MQFKCNTSRYRVNDKTNTITCIKGGGKSTAFIGNWLLSDKKHEIKYKINKVGYGIGIALCPSDNKSDLSVQFLPKCYTYFTTGIVYSNGKNSHSYKFPRSKWVVLISLLYTQRRKD